MYSNSGDIGCLCLVMRRLFWGCFLGVFDYSSIYIFVVWKYYIICMYVYVLEDYIYIYMECQEVLYYKIMERKIDYIKSKENEFHLFLWKHFYMLIKLPHNIDFILVFLTYNINYILYIYWLYLKNLENWLYNGFSVNI